jgi:flagellar biosynthesis protein FlhF
MNISRFFGSTNREAMRQVRMALGADALIVSNRRVNGGVEILATDPTFVPPEFNTATAVADPPPRAVQEPERQRPRQSATVAPQADVMGAIGDLRGSLETRIDELLWGSQLRRAPQAVSLFQAMLGFGFSTALLRAMLKRLPEHLPPKAALQWARQELIDHLPVLAREDDLWTSGRVLALVGPTGVGKTTTIAKLAARCVKRQGAEKVVLLTTDTYRIGAHEQLKIYGQMMRVPVHVVQDMAELNRIVSGIRPDQTILIDNIGISQRDRYIAEQAAMLAGAGRPVQRLLVLNASSHGDTLDEVARSYCNDGGEPISGCIVTKLDEASRLGAALDTAIRYQLPIHYVSNGQKVPEDLLFLSARDLIDQALAHKPQGQALYAPTEADFAALMSLAKTPEAESGGTVPESRRRLLLPPLMAMMSAGAAASASLAKTDLTAAWDFVKGDLACASALDLWRTHAGTGPAVSLRHAIDQHLASMHNELACGDGSYVLAVHDGVALRSAPDSQTHLRASLLLTERGEALGSPLQLLTQAEGWSTSTGESALAAPSAGDALFHQVECLDQATDLLPCVHLIEAGGPGVWRRLSSQRWLAHVPGATKLDTESGPTIVTALAKTLDYRLAASALQHLSLVQVAGVAIDDLAFWVGSERVGLPARQKAGVQALNMLAVRVVNRHDGRIVQTHFGLSNLPSEQIGIDLQASWLIMQAELKTCFRYTACGWGALAGGDQADSPQKKALLAVRLALAAWQLRQTPAAAAARSLLDSLAGKSSPAAVMKGLVKLFALHEIIA